PEVFNVLLQVLDDGRLTDGHGRTVDFRNVVVIMTSNIGSQYYNGPVLDEEGFQRARANVIAEVRSFFRPEFVNRIDEIAVFRPLGLSEIEKIVKIQLELVGRRLAERRIEIEITPEATLQLATEGYDPVYGARPLKRTIQTSILNPLSQKLLAGEIRDGDRIEVGAGPEGFVFRTLEPVATVGS
ncbi:MAG: AAA family ATPase, partial [Fimbriimonadaceae bacterium]